MRLEVQLFQKDLHLAEYKRLLNKRGLFNEKANVFMEKFLPPTGCVVYHDDKIVCMGFLVKCDNKMGILTDLVSDNEVPKKERNQAVRILRATLMGTAQKDGIQFITSFTKHKKLAAYLETIGFTRLDDGFTQMGRFLWL